MASYIEHTVLGSAPPPWDTTGYNDFGTGGWLASNFYTGRDAPETGWALIGGRIFNPSHGAPWDNGTLTATMGYYIQTVPGGGPIRTDVNNEALMITLMAANAQPPINLQPGWNEVRLPTPIPVPWGYGVAIGWQVGDGNYYVFGKGSDVDIRAGGAGLGLYALDGAPLALSGDIPVTGFERRGVFGIPNVNGSWAYQGAWYGADIIMGKASADVPASGTFAGTYGWGPASMAGSIPTAGSFGGEYGWRPATATGSAPSSGTFASQYGWGAAVFTGETTTGGAFTGSYGWRPATMAGEATPQGSFSSAYVWGPATMAGVASVGGDFGGTYGWGPARFTGFSGELLPFPECDLDLTGTAPSLTLEGFAPELTLEGSCSL